LIFLSVDFSLPAQEPQAHRRIAQQDALYDKLKEVARSL